MTVSVQALGGIPEIRPGDDLGELILAAVPDRSLLAGDIVVVAHKAVSKAEGRLRNLGEVTASSRAQALAAGHDRDPRHVQVVLDESQEILRATRGLLISVTPHGFVCANAGVDASNVPGSDTLVLLPEDPDGSARGLRRRLRALTGVAPGIVITDSFGRAWRNGQADVAIGCAGIEPLQDWRGRADSGGRELRATWIATADELAAAADLARDKDGAEPAVLIRGAGRYVTEADGPGAAALLREPGEDLFR